MKIVVAFIVGIVIITAEGLLAARKLRNWSNLTGGQKAKATLDVAAMGSLILIGGAVGVALVLAN